MHKRSIIRWAVHKIGSEQFGCLCESEDEAKEMLADSSESNDNYIVKQVEVSWCENV